MQDMTLVLMKNRIYISSASFDQSYGSVQEGNLLNVAVGHEQIFY